MSPQQAQPADSLQRLELIISHLLRIGVLIAGTFLLVGWLMSWYTQGDMLSTFQTYESQSIIESIHWALVMNNKGLIISYFGLLILVSLPVLRVFMTGFLFIRQKEYTLAFMAYGVFFALLLSVLLGIEI
ncbi:hypothetical protein D3C87_257350 [compost metagenome]